MQLVAGSTTSGRLMFNFLQSEKNLGLDGDCDFSLRTSESYPFRCTKEDLLSLIDRQVHEAIQPMAQSNDYLVLDRRYAVYLPDILDEQMQPLAM